MVKIDCIDVSVEITLLGVKIKYLKLFRNLF